MFRVYCIMNKVWTKFRQPTEAGKHLETDHRRQELTLGLKTEEER